ncbi:MAG TPA: tetratricopeptide repeat protein [Candidatus Krumholzibacteria bacterium]|nr:tetratricopeptide repeat protein [Candidatus Krumholzibacteria bacterium]
MSARAWAALALAAGLAAAAAGAARAQAGGRVDTRAGVAERIRELEMQVGGDEPAEKQAVMLRWLADLYVSAGRLDDAERAYQQILAFFPFDPATSNAYAIFLLEQRDNAVLADTVLHDALTNANAQETPPPYIGQTYALRARALRALGRCDEALAPSDHALAMLDEDAAEDALRVKAACLAETGKFDEARRCYEELIGAGGGSNPHDISGYIALRTASSGSVDEVEVRSAIAFAVENARAKRREAAEAEGATIVELRAEDGARIEATLRPGTTPRAVLFVPESGARRSAYTPYAQLLSLDGITTLTLDPRGHGDSRSDSLPDPGSLSDTHRGRIAGDIATAVEHLRDVEKIPLSGIAIITAGDAGGFAERARHEHALAVASVHLSPTFDPEDRALASALSFRPPRPALLFASNEDVYAVRSLGFFLDSAGSDGVTTRIFRGAGHGTTLLRDPARFAALRRWIEKTLVTED